VVWYPSLCRERWEGGIKAAMSMLAPEAAEQPRGQPGSHERE
jgi:hypothetical protein